MSACLCIATHCKDDTALGGCTISGRLMSWQSPRIGIASYRLMRRRLRAREICRRKPRKGLRSQPHVNSGATNKLACWR